MLLNVNAAPLKAAGITDADVRNRPFWDCYWWNYDPEVQAQVRGACERAARGESSRYDVPVRTAGDTRTWIDFQIAPLRDETGRITHLIPSAMVITERKQAEQAIKTSLAEKEVLLKEIHHRVKNNMQVISSLLALQANHLQDERMRVILDELTYRVRSMALVHEKLYQSADLAKVEFHEYARSLLDYLWRAHRTSVSEIHLALNLEQVSLPVNVAVPCGLILNELVVNALKHAFKGRAGGEVVVSLHAAEGGMRFSVRDNGEGLPAGFDWRQTNSLGLRLVSMLAGQLHADVEVSSNGGTEFTITFGGGTK